MNPERGDVELKLGDAKVVLSPEMARFANLSHNLGTKSLSELLQRIQGMEPYTMLRCIEAFATEGDIKGILSEMNDFRSLAIVRDKMLVLVSALIEPPAKNDESEAAKS